MSPILPEVLELLVCPAPECRRKLNLEADALLCPACGRKYRIDGAWPVLIPEEAEGPVRANESHSESK